MNAIRAVVLACWLGGALGIAQAGPRVVVICNAALSLADDDVRSIYLGDKQLAGSTRLVPVDNASAQVAFLVHYVNLDAAKYRSRWIKKAFRDGLTAPETRATDLAVIEFVRNTPGAIGYVMTEAPQGVTVLGGRP